MVEEGWLERRKRYARTLGGLFKSSWRIGRGDHLTYSRHTIFENAFDARLARHPGKLAASSGAHHLYFDLAPVCAQEDDVPIIRLDVGPDVVQRLLELVLFDLSSVDDRLRHCTWFALSRRGS